MTEPTTPVAPSAIDRAQALIDPQLRLLTRLAEIGLDAAEAVGRQIRGETETSVTKGDPSLAYARASRAVRMTVALQSKLIEALAALEAGPAAGADEPRPDPDYILKARVERIVERAAEAEHDGDDDEVDRLTAEAGERLDDIDLYGDLLDRPVSEILARICRDIGLPLSWSRLAEEAWAQSEMRGGQAGAPLMALLETLDCAPPPLPDPDGARRRRTAARLAVTARRGRRAEEAKARGPDTRPIEYEVRWVDVDETPARGSG